MLAPGGTDGIEFVPWVDIEVSALGYYDFGGDGFTDTHRVVIFDDATQRKVTEIVTVDSGSDLHADGYRYEAITPTVLKAGTSYVLAGEISRKEPADVAPEHSGQRSFAPEIRYVAYREIREYFGYPKATYFHHFAPANFLFMPVSAE